MARTACFKVRTLQWLTLSVGAWLALGVAHAQVRVEGTSEAIRGRAPVVVFEPLENQTVPGRAPAVGHALRVEADASDPDGDAIDRVTYRWRRDGAEIATGTSYVPVMADAGKTLVVEAIAETDPVSTDPATATATLDVFVAANSAPAVANVDIAGTFAVGQTLTGSYTFVDDDGDPEDAAGMEYAWYVSNPDTGALVQVGTGRTYVVRREDQGLNQTVVFSVEKAKSLTGTPNERTRPTTPGGQWQRARSGLLIGGGMPVAANLAIDGTLQVGQVLTGRYDFSDPDDDPEEDSSLLWYRAVDATGHIPSTREQVGQGPTYTVQAGDVGYHLVFQVVPKTNNVHYPSVGIDMRVATATAVPGRPPSATGLTLSGPPVAGQTVTVDYHYADEDGDQEGGTLYQWYRHKPGVYITAIPGANAKSYTVQAADHGSHRLLVEVTPKSATGTPDTGATVQVESTVDISGTVGPRATNLTVTGTMLVGQALTGMYIFEDPEHDPEGASTFKWYRADNAEGTIGKVLIAGATSAVYTLVRADQGKYIVFEVTPVSLTGANNIGEPASQVSATSIIGRDPYVANMRITGRPTVGSTVTFEYDYIDPDDDPEGATVFNWCRFGVACGLGTARTYVITAADVGHSLNGEITPKSQTGTPDTGTTVTVAQFPETGTIQVEAAPTATNLAIAGTLATGQTLTGSYTYADDNDDAEGASTYRWYRAADAAGAIDKSVIAGATSTTYTIVPADEGKYLVFEVTPVSQTGAPDTGEPANRVATTPVAVPGTAPTATNLSLSAPPVAGQTITVDYAYFDAEGDAESGTLYQWYWHRPGWYLTPIAGATGKSYTVTAADRGPRRLLVQVTPKSATGTPDTGEMIQVQSDADILGRPPTMSPPTITGVLGVGSTLTGWPTGFVDPDGDGPGIHDYRWYRADDASGTINRTQIPWANTLDYRMVAEDQGKYLVFEVMPASHGSFPIYGEPVSGVTSNIVTGMAPTVGSVSISGTYAVGSTLTGHYNYADGDNDPEDTTASGTTYQWYVDDPVSGAPVAVPGATGRSFVIRPEDQGANRRIWFNVEIVRSTNGVPKQRIGPWGTSRTGLVAGPPQTPPVATNVQITGRMAVGAVLTASFDYDDANGDPQGGTTYQWCMFDGTTGAQVTCGSPGTAFSTLTLESYHLNRRLDVRVVPRSSTGTPDTGEEVLSARTPVVAEEQGPVALNVDVEGERRVGQTLSPRYTYFDANGDLEGGTSYWWRIRIDGNAWSIVQMGANPNFTVRPQDAGKEIIVDVFPRSLTGNPDSGSQYTSPVYTILP